MINKITANSKLWDIIYLHKWNVKRKMVVATNREWKLILIDYPTW